MAEVRISDEARIDLEDIRGSGIAQFGDVAAERHLRVIRHTFELLAGHPFIGQERPEFRDGIRSISRKPHRVLYTATEENVLIVRVIHQARDVAAALRGEQ